MFRRTAYLLLTACTIGLSAPAGAENSGLVVKLPNDPLAFKAPLAGLPQTAVLYGDPAKPGLYVARVKFPAGIKVMPHTHTDEVRTILVLSGTMYFGVGEQWDESKLQAYPAGTFFTEPANTPHFAWAKDGEVVAHLTSIGPSGTKFIAQQK